MTTTKAPITRLSTGVPGLDEVLGGGLPEFSFNLIAGPPGCGKTTLAHQIMFSLATEEHPAIYFTVLGEPPLKMLRYQQQFDFFDSAKVNHAVRFINLVFDMFVQEPLARAKHQGGLGIGLAVVRQLVEAHGGTVTAHSAGKTLGSQFVVRLPLSREGDAANDGMTSLSA